MTANILPFATNGYTKFFTWVLMRYQAGLKKNLLKILAGQ
jgi:hypothetical protein